LETELGLEFFYDGVERRGVLVGVGRVDGGVVVDV
jgi:hypothetical protein